MGLTVQIDAGRIVVMHPNEREIKSFTDQDEAVAYVGYHIADKSLGLSFAESCRDPAANGRPTFRVQDFQEDTAAEIHRIQSSMRSMAA